MIYDMQQLFNEVNNAEGEDDTPVIGTVTIEGKEIELDLLGFEYDEVGNVMWFYLGPRR